MAVNTQQEVVNMSIISVHLTTTIATWDGGKLVGTLVVLDRVW